MRNANQEPVNGRTRRTNKPSGTHCGEGAVTDPNKAVFLSYASQDAEAAQNLCNALRAADIEVWFDQSELRGGDAWDASIRRQIKNCALFIPVISRNTHARDEGYFRLEWKLAVDRSHLMAVDKAFLLPVVIDDTRDNDDRVPDRFRELQWTRLPGGRSSPAFVERIRKLTEPDPGLAAAGNPAAAAPVAPGNSARAVRSSKAWALLLIGVGVLGVAAYIGLHHGFASKPDVTDPAPAAAA